MKTTNLSQIMEFKPCYDPKEIGIMEGKEYPITPRTIGYWHEKCHNKADIVWLLCRNEFMSDKDLRLFAVWCARREMALVKNPDQRSIDAINVAERFANGEATDEELQAARVAARYAARVAAGEVARVAAGEVARVAAWYAAWDAAWYAEWYAARSAARAAERDAQVEQLKTYFK